MAEEKPVTSIANDQPWLLSQAIKGVVSLAFNQALDAGTTFSPASAIDLVVKAYFLGVQSLAGYLAPRFA